MATDIRWVGVCLVATGVATLTFWFLRARGRHRPPVVVATLGYGGLAGATAIGLAATAAEVGQALGLD